MPVAALQELLCRAIELNTSGHVREWNILSRICPHYHSFASSSPKCWWVSISPASVAFLQAGCRWLCIHLLRWVFTDSDGLNWVGLAQSYVRCLGHHRNYCNISYYPLFVSTMCVFPRNTLRSRLHVAFPNSVVSVNALFSEYSLTQRIPSFPSAEKWRVARGT